MSSFRFKAFSNAHKLSSSRHKKKRWNFNFMGTGMGADMKMAALWVLVGRITAPYAVSRDLCASDLKLITTSTFYEN
jgi:hypothetical protein